MLFLAAGAPQTGAAGRRLFLAGLAVGLELLFYFVAIRLTNVTVGVSLEYLAPVYLTLEERMVLHTRRGGSTWWPSRGCGRDGVHLLPRVTVAGGAAVISVAAAIVLSGACAEQPSVQPQA